MQHQDFESNTMETETTATENTETETTAAENKREEIGTWICEWNGQVIIKASKETTKSAVLNSTVEYFRSRNIKPEKFMLYRVGLKEQPEFV